VLFVIGSLPTFTIAIHLTWSEWHRLRKPEKIDMAAYPSILNHSLSTVVMNSMMPSLPVRFALTIATSLAV
jgi:hypothetical protein